MIWMIENARTFYPDFASVPSPWPRNLISPSLWFRMILSSRHKTCNSISERHADESLWSQEASTQPYPFTPCKSPRELSGFRLIQQCMNSGVLFMRGTHALLIQIWATGTSTLLCCACGEYQKWLKHQRSVTVIHASSHMRWNLINFSAWLMLIALGLIKKKRVCSCNISLYEGTHVHDINDVTTTRARTMHLNWLIWLSPYF